MRYLTVLFVALSAPGATITTLDLNTYVQIGDPPCSYHGAGPSFACSSQGQGSNGDTAGAVASGYINGNAITVSANSLKASGASASASLTQTDYYLVQSQSSVFATFFVACQQTGIGSTVKFSLGNGPLSDCTGDSSPRIAVTPANGRVWVTSFISVSDSVADNPGSASASITFVGLQDVSGNPVASTPNPEPATWGMLLAGLAVYQWIKPRTKPAPKILPG